jgi:CBS domain-containing protein
MHCPACGYDNLIGTEVCDNCGADLAGHDLPQPAVTFHSTLLGEHLDELGAPAPILVELDAPVGDAIEAMHAAGADCVLVVSAGRLVGIFTDRDAVVKLAGRPIDGLLVRDYMTPDPVVLRHDDPIAVAIHKMAIGGFRHIPILEDGRPAGVVSARDVFHHLAEGFD